MSRYIDAEELKEEFEDSVDECMNQPLYKHCPYCGAMMDCKDQ